MSFLIDVAVPEMALNSLTYESPVFINTGCRVIIEIKKTLHTGFVLGLSEKNLSSKIKIKTITGIIDYESVITPDIWDMSLWAGKVCLCGAGAALKAILPAPVIKGEKVEASPKFEISKNFREVNYFNPFDSERVNFYVDELKKNKRTLILFPHKKAAENFYEIIPDEIKNQALLWTASDSRKLWELWKSVQAENFKIIIASSGGIFAPLVPEKIIIENEADSAYIIPPVLNISARSLAGRRAMFSGAELILAGRIPSLKTFFRSKPVQNVRPERKNLIFADIFHFRTQKEKLNGIEGNIPLTISLIKRTYRELYKNNNVIWILDRLGESSEVFCENCGTIIKCEKCGGIMRSENDGNFLKCKICGNKKILPRKCEKCGYEFFLGRRPGLEALEKIVKKYYKNVKIYDGSKPAFSLKSSKTKMHGLILSTRRGIELCDSINPSLIAWLDIDFELWGTDYDTRLKVFNFLWESYWRGREKNSERKILIQARSAGMKFAGFLTSGWEKFMLNELKERHEFMLPPYGFIIEIACSKKLIRDEIIKIFNDAGIFVMDPGENHMPVYVNTNSLKNIEKILESLNPTFRKNLKITVKS